LNDYLCTVNFNGENYKTDELMINLKFADTKLNIEEDNMAKVHLNLAIAKDKYYNKEEINTFERYLAILMLTNVEELKKLAKGDEILESVARDLISYSRAREIVDAYEKEMLEENYQRNRLEATKEEAEKRGMEEGVKKGIEQGIEQGTKQRNVEIAKNLLSLKLSKEDISKATGLSIKEIEALK
jgi:predicted transposase/invertase (TIGR01784 family)